MVGPAEAAATIPGDREWRVDRQDIRLEVLMDEKKLRGSCELVVVGLEPTVSSINLNLACARVAKVAVDAADSSFILRQRATDLGNLAAVRLGDLEATRAADASDRDNGELTISLPANRAQATETTVHIEYETVPGTDSGLKFAEDPGFPGQTTQSESIPYLFADSRFGKARTWFPCVDTNKEKDRTQFKVEFTINNHNRDGLPPFMAVASGRPAQVKQAATKRTFLYETSAPCTPAEVSFAVGPFQVLPDPNYPSKVTHFCLPSYNEPLIHTSPPVLQRVLPFFSAYFGGGTSASDPLSATRSAGMKLLYLGNRDIGSLPLTFSSGFVLLSGDLLHLPDQIEPEFHARYSIAYAVASFYFGSLVRPRTKEDSWLTLGLALHLAALFCRTILGQNWYRFFVLDQIDTVTERGSKGVVLNDVSGSAVFASATRHRAHLLVHMIERRSGADVFKRVLRDVVGEALSGKTLVGDTEGTPGTVGVAPLLKHVRAVCGTDLRALVKWWVNTAGIPRFQCAYRYDNKKHQVEFALKHDVVYPAGKQSRDMNTKSISVSSLTVRVMELEGPNESAVELRDTVQVTEFPCLSRRTKQKVMKPSDGGTGGSAAQDTQPTQNLQPTTGSCPILWVRVDPEMEWAKELVFQQPQAAWISVLKGERDAPTQLAACRGLGRQPSHRGADALANALIDKRIYYRVRVASVHALGRCADASIDYIGLDRLLEYYEKTFMYKDGGRSYVKPNDFSDLSDYYVRLAIVDVLGTIRGAPSVRVASFLIDLVEFNDNEMNLFSDEMYLASLVRSLGRVLKHTRDGQLIGRALKQFDRSENVDRVLRKRDGVLRLAVKEARAECMFSKSAFEKLEWHLFFSPVYSFQKQALRAFARMRPMTLRDMGRLMSLIDGKGLDTVAHVVHTRLKRKIFRVLWKYMTDGSGLLLDQLRTPTRAAAALCIRLVRYSFTSFDAEESRMGRDICFLIWGKGAPVCLLSDEELENWHTKIEQLAAQQAIEAAQASENAKVETSPIPPPASQPEVPIQKATAKDAAIALAMTAAAKAADSTVLKPKPMEIDGYDSEDQRYLRLAYARIVRKSAGADSSGAVKKLKKKKKRVGNDGQSVDGSDRKKKKKKKKRRDMPDTAEGGRTESGGLKIKIKLPVPSSPD